MKINEIVTESNMGTQTQFAVGGYKYTTDIEEQDDVDKIQHYVTTPRGRTGRVDFTPYAYMTQDDVRMYVKLGMPPRAGVKPLDSQQLQQMSQTSEAAVDETPASRSLCTSGKPDSALGASNLSSCKSQGYRSRDGGKSHKVGSERIGVRGKKIKGKKYGGPLPDWS